MISFDEFLKQGTIKKITPDKNRADSLIEDAEKRKAFLEQVIDKVQIDDENANYIIENVYDILIQLIRARLFLDGYKSSGEGAHAAEVSYMKKLSFDEAEIRFMDSLRNFRNRIKYYGKRYDKDYAESVLAFMSEIYAKLNR